MIKTIIFDIGNVLMKFDYMPYIKNLLKDDLLIEKVNKAIWYTGCWNDLDRGYDTGEVLKKMIEAEPDYADEIRLTFDNVGECIHRADYAIPWIEDLKARGYKVLYLSNYAEHTMKANEEALDFIQYMDGGVFSCYVGVIKPDPALFETICDKYGLVKDECVFIDDSEANTNAAAELGMKAIHFTNYDQAKKKLEEILKEL